MRKLFLISLSSLAVTSITAQPPVAPATEQAGNPRGDNSGNYNIIQSFELGYRFGQGSWAP